MGVGVTIPIDKTSFFTFSLFAVENTKFQHLLCSGSESSAKCPSQGLSRARALLRLFQRVCCCSVGRGLFSKERCGLWWRTDCSAGSCSFPRPPSSCSTAFMQRLTLSRPSPPSNLCATSFSSVAVHRSWPAVHLGEFQHGSEQTKEPLCKRHRL